MNNVLDSDAASVTHGIVLCNDNLSSEDNLIYIPIYMIMCIKNDEPESSIYKIDISDI